MAIEKLTNYINGKFIPSITTDFREIKNPATDETMALVPMSTKEEVDHAVASAIAAFPAWRNTPGVQRIQPFFKLLDLFKAHLDEIAEAIVKNHGKEWDAAYGEAVRAYQMIESAFSVPELQKGEFMEDVATGIDEYSVLEPLGVFAMIPPFNFPAMIPFWFLPWAVMSGNTYIVKINEQTPLAMQVITKFIDQAGFPKGVINCIHGSVDVANQLIDHPDVKGVSSVGSTPVAKMIYSRACFLGKRAQCHGGANNFLVVCSDANLDKILGNMMNSIFGNGGQRCLAGKKVVAVGDDKFYAYFKKRFIETAKNLKVGYGMDKSSFMGPIVSKKSLDKLTNDIGKAVKEGATILLDGRGLKVPNFDKGYWLGPTILENTKPGMYCFEEEIFGPVCSMHHVKTLDEAIIMINTDNRGNATSIYTESGENARHFRHEVAPGMIGINIGVVAPIAWFPFAGSKDSFFGTMRGQGRECLKFFTVEHVVIEKFHGSTKIEWD